MAISTSNNVGAGAATAATTSSKATKADNSPEAIQERFMSLLVAQLKNQDPMAPMDNAQVTSQMAQLNTVTGISDLNKSMDTMVTAMGANQTVQATSMLGRSVLVDGSSMSLKGGEANGAFELKQPVDKLSVDVMDRGGNVIKTIDLGNAAKGVHEFKWDGTNADGKTMADGAYSFQIQASAAGVKVDASTMVKTEVQGVRNAGTAGAMLLTANGSEVSLGSVKQIF